MESRSPIRLEDRTVVLNRQFNQKQTIWASIMSDFFLPEALMMNIWLNLSIKSTVRFRCVSKSWCATLSNPHFIYKNLTFSDAANHLLLVNLERPHYSVVSPETLLATPLQVPPEVTLPEGYNRNVLSPPCGDLVCFNNKSFGSSMGVWNLITGETKIVPPVCSGYTFLTHGFGFDEKNKDYKIVQILYGLDYFVAYVYSLSSSNNCWRKVGEPKMLYIKDYGAVEFYSRSYRDGTFYWGSTDLIVSFDMSSEVFNMMSIPFLDGRSSCIQEICKLKEGSMLMITGKLTSEYPEPRLTEYEIWGLLELGATQSWTKLLVIDWVCEDDEPLSIWRNELVLKSHSDGRLLIIDPFKRETKEVQIDEPHDITRWFVWTKGKNTLINF